jgi:uncharacterized membrane protein YhaH (DUF805 family)
MFYLFNVLISIGLNVLVFVNETLGIVGTLYSLAVILPAIAVGVRRMHDNGKSGWFLLIPIYNFILLVSNGDQGPNEYGDDPKQENKDSEDLLDSNI